MNIDMSKIGVRVTALIILLLASVLLVGGIALTRMTTINEAFTTVYQDRVVPMKQLQNVADGYFLGMVDTAHKVRDGAMTPEQGIKTVNDAIPGIQAEWEAYLKTELTPTEKQLAAEMTQRMKAVEGLPTTLLGFLKANDMAGLKAWAAKDMYPTLDPIADSVAKLMDLQRDVAKEEFELSTSKYHQAMYMAAIVVVLAVVAGTIFGYLLAHGLVRQLGGQPAQATHVVHEIAAGNLSVHVPAEQADANSLMGQMRFMRDRLADLVNGVLNGSEEIATGATQIATGNADLSHRTEEQASNLQRTTHAVGRLNETVQATAHTAREAATLASEASTTAEKGGQVVHQVVQTMTAINTSSKRISDIIGVIDGIAFQTNILALNAAVEAARAGEQGRGFAVVASEVRNLAQRSASAAKEIKALIGDSVEKVNQGSKLVADAGVTMDEIVASVHKVSDMISEITAASTEQSAGIHEVNQAIGSMDAVTQQNAALVEQAAAAAESMQQQAAALAHAVSVFKVDGTPRLSQARKPLQIARSV